MAAHERGPDFTAFRSVEIRNARTGEPAELVRADAVAPTPERVAEVARICNEPLVYDVLFRRGLGGAPYPPEKARGFLEWAHRGWREGTHFVFLVRSGSGAILAALDIKAARLEADEIGYWATAEKRGFMTPAVAVLCDLARGAGYRSLYARTRPDNERSAAVLRRNGFREPVRPTGGDPDALRTFVKSLDPAATRAAGHPEAREEADRHRAPDGRRRVALQRGGAVDGGAEHDQAPPDGAQGERAAGIDPLPDGEGGLRQRARCSD